MTFDITKITADIGARVHDVDPAGDLSDDTVRQLRLVLAEHKALVFEAPDLDAAGQERFAARFGRLTTAHPTVPGVRPRTFSMSTARSTRPTNGTPT